MKTIIYSALATLVVLVAAQLPVRADEWVASRPVHATMNTDNGQLVLVRGYRGGYVGRGYGYGGRGYYRGYYGGYGYAPYYRGYYRGFYGYPYAAYYAYPYFSYYPYTTWSYYNPAYTGGFYFYNPAIGTSTYYYGGY